MISFLLLNYYLFYGLLLAWAVNSSICESLLFVLPKKIIWSSVEVVSKEFLDN